MAAVAQSGVGSDDRRQFNHHHHHRHSNHQSSDRNSELQRDVRELVDFLSKLNPSAKEFVPSSYSSRRPNAALSADAPLFVSNYDQTNNQRDSSSDGSSNGYQRRKHTYNQGRRRVNDKVRRAQREDRIRRTVYVADIDQHVTEEELAGLFANCGQVEDCRACGDPNSVLRFAFVEFVDEQSAREALNLTGTVLGYYPVRVLPSKTAILPVNPTYLPQTEAEKEMCTRTVYCTNIDKKISQADVKTFFGTTCGAVSRLRLLGDHVHSTLIAFVEFAMAESALEALNCSGMFLGELPIRVSPSKTPVRSRVPRGILQ